MVFTHTVVSAALRLKRICEIYAKVLGTEEALHVRLHTDCCTTTERFVPLKLCLYLSASQYTMRKRTGVRRSTPGAATQPISPQGSWHSMAGETASKLLQSASLDEPLISCPLPCVGCWGSLLAGCTSLAQRRPPSGAATWRVQCRLESEQPERSDRNTRPYQHNRPSLFCLFIEAHGSYNGPIFLWWKLSSTWNLNRSKYPRVFS